jgi:hypothetical protein
LELEGEPLVVVPEQMQNGGVEIGDVERILDDVVAESSVSP